MSNIKDDLTEFQTELTDLMQLPQQEQNSQQRVKRTDSTEL